MNTDKEHIDYNTNNNNSFHKEGKVKSSKKKRPSKLTNIMKLNLPNKAKISNDIIDIEDSHDIATWNKDVMRNKDRYTIKKTPIPTITTDVLKKGKKDNNGIDYLIDPANLNEIAKVYHNEEIITDQSNFSQKKEKLKKRIKF